MKVNSDDFKFILQTLNRIDNDAEVEFQGNAWRDGARAPGPRAGPSGDPRDHHQGSESNRGRSATQDPRDSHPSRDMGPGRSRDVPPAPGLRRVRQHARSDLRRPSPSRTTGRGSRSRTRHQPVSIGHPEPAA